MEKAEQTSYQLFRQIISIKKKKERKRKLTASWLCSLGILYYFTSHQHADITINSWENPENGGKKRFHNFKEDNKLSKLLSADVTEIAIIVRHYLWVRSSLNEFS